MTKVLMLGLDGVSYPMLEPAFDEGHMPRLRALLAGGASGVLTSTIPPYTPPGWTSIFTGVNPGRHGIFGFTLGNVQHPGGLVRLDRVRAPALWNAANAQGASIGLFNVPMTYPPPPVTGFAVSGMLTPEEGGATPSNFTHPHSLAGEIERAAGSYEIDIEVNYDEDWKSTAIVDRLSRNLATKKKAFEFLLAERGTVDILFAVLEAPDRLMHVHYKYIDPRFEHYHRPEARPVRERVWSFFDEMDDFVATALAWAGDDAFVVTMSDHGFQGKDKSVNVNYLLREWGLLETSRGAAAVGSGGARKVAHTVKKTLPKSFRRRLKGVAQSSIDWSRTHAFSAPIPQQGIYVNLEGREPHGVVTRARYDAVRAEIMERFSAVVDPDDGAPVLDRIYRREEVIDGDEAEHAPDLFPVCRGYAYELSDGLFSMSALTDYRALPRGFHHMEGIFGIAGPGVEARSGARASLYDIAPTALYLAGLKVPDVDGDVLTACLPADLLHRRPVERLTEALPLAGEGAEASPYSKEDEAQIEESLRNLGYL